MEIIGYEIPIIVEGFLLAVLVSLVIIPLIVRHSKQKNWLDKPNQRKVHKVAVPTMGGLGIFLAMLASVLLFPNFISHTSIVVIGGAIVMFVIGIIDDRRELRPRLKLVIELLVSICIVFSGIRITSLYGIFGINMLPIWISYLLSIVCIAFFINAFNLIDGIDGLAGGLGLIISIMFAIIFFSSGAIGFALMAASLAGGCLGFLFFNFNPARIFMGDTGSLPIGLLLAVFSIHTVQFHEFITIKSVSIDSVPIVLALIIIPSLDAIRVFTTRLFKKVSPFRPDKTHIHHIMLNTGFNHRTAALTLCFFQLLLIGIVVTAPIVGIIIALAQFILFIGIVVAILNASKHNKRNTEFEEV